MKFKISVKHLILIYPLKDSVYEKELLIKIVNETLVLLSKKIKIQTYYIGILKEENNYILSCYLGLYLFKDSIDSSFFDLQLECLNNIVLVGNYKGCNYFSNIVASSIEFISNISSLQKELGALDFEEKLIEIAKQEGFNAARNFYLKNYLLHYGKKGGKIVLEGIKMLTDFHNPDI